MTEEIFLLPGKGKTNTVLISGLDVKVVRPSFVQDLVFGIQKFKPANLFGVPTTPRLSLGESKILGFSVVDNLFDIASGHADMPEKKLNEQIGRNNFQNCFNGLALFCSLK